MMGTPKHKIASKLLEDFDGVYARASIYRILGTDFTEESESSHDETNSSSLNTQYEEENFEELVIADSFEQLCHLWKSKLRTGPWASELDPKERKELNTRHRGLIAIASDCMDERGLVPKPLQNLLIYSALESTIADAYSIFYLKVKDVIKKLTADRKIRGIRTTEEISSKQSHRIVYKKIKDLFTELEPTNEHEARIDGFSGQICPNCKCRRCERVPDASGDRWYECARCGPEKHFVGIFTPAYSDPNAKTVEMDGDGNTFVVKVEMGREKK